MEFTTPVGRLVSGDVFNGNEKDRKGQPYIIKTGPNAGKPTKKWFFAVAFPKMLANGMPNEEFNNFYRAVIDTARAGYPAHFNGPIDPFTGKPGCTHPRMALKIADGDGTDEDGKPNNQKEGWAGHWVVKFNGQYAPRCFRLGQFAPEQQLQDPNSLKRGWYVSVSGTCEANIGSDVPGVYMNGNLVCLVDSSAPVIVSGPNAAEAFANIPMGSLPAGVTVGGVASGAAAAAPQTYAPTAPNGVAQYAAAAPAPAAATAPAQTAPVQPNHGFVANAGHAPAAPTAPQAPEAPAAPAGPQLTPAGVQAGGTYAAFQANGWTDQQLREHGFLV